MSISSSIVMQLSSEDETSSISANRFLGPVMLPDLLSVSYSFAEVATNDNYIEYEPVLHRRSFRERPGSELKDLPFDRGVIDFVTYTHCLGAVGTPVNIW